ncbi:MAG: hypothetical protein AABX89_07580 [Candidatus Thermoplasmatota archaeon]
MTPESDLPASSVEVRRRILLLVERYPGLHLREIQRRIETSAMLAEYHLNILEKMELISSQEQGGYRNFYPARNLPMQLDATDRRWLALLRRPVVLGMVLHLIEYPTARPTELARIVQLPSSTAMYQLKTMKAAGLVVQGDDFSTTRIRLGDADRVLELLRTYHPMPDALSEFGSMWARAIQAFQASPALPEPVLSTPLVAKPDLPPAVRGLPVSAQALYEALLAGPLTGKELGLETGLARRTVYNSINMLRRLELLEERGNLRDMRQTRYWLKSDATGPKPETTA